MITPFKATNENTFEIAMITLFSNNWSHGGDTNEHTVEVLASMSQGTSLLVSEQVMSLSTMPEISKT
jgi:hypothetical protein